MIKLLRLCGDFFAEEQRPLEDLSAGLRDHFTKLEDYPHGGAFDGIITATRDVVARWNAIELRINAGQNTQQEGRDITTDDREKALNRLRRNYAALDAIEDDKLRDKLLKRFYPQGLEQYTESRIDSLDPLLQAYLKLVTDSSSAELPDGFAARTTADFGASDAARDEQVEEQADTTRAREARKLMVPEVTSQLTDNLHFLCWHFKKERAQAISFFNRRYFETDYDDEAEEIAVASVVTPPPPG